MLRRATRIAKRAGQADLLAVHVLRGDGLAGAPVGATRHAAHAGRGRRRDVPHRRRRRRRRGGHRRAARLRPRRQRHPARARHLAALAAGPAVRPRASAPGWCRTPARSTCTWSPTPRPGAALPAARAAQPRPGGRRVLGWALAVLAARGGDRAGRLAASVIGLSTDVVLFFLATVVVALVGGLGPALLAALLGGLLLNFFLTPPLYSFTIGRAGERRHARRDGGRRRCWSRSSSTGRPGGPSRPRARAPRRRCWPRSRAPCSPAPTRCRGCWRRCRESFGLRSVALLEASGRRPGSAGWRRSPRPARRSAAGRRTADVDVARRARPAPRRHRPLAGRRRPAAAGGGRRAGAAGAAQPARRRRTRPGSPPPRGGHRDPRRAALGRRARPAQPADLDQGRGRQPARPDLRLSDADRAELLATVEESADRLTALVDNLLDSSRLAAGRGRRRCSRRSATTRWRPGRWPGSRTRGRVALDIDEGLPDVLADAGLLERVVANLVDNALRHAARRTRRAARQHLRRPRRAARRRRRAGRADEGPRAAVQPRSSAWATADAHHRGRARAVGRPRVHRGDGRHAHGGGHSRRGAHDRGRPCRSPARARPPPRRTTRTSSAPGRARDAPRPSGRSPAGESDGPRRCVPVTSRRG